MARIALIIIAVSVLAGSLFVTWKSGTEPLEMRNTVCTTRDVKKGGTITADALEIRQVGPIPNQKNHVDLYSVEKMELAIGHKARHRLSKGQTIFPRDLDPYPPGFTSVVPDFETSAADLINRDAPPVVTPK